jgi:3'(2'), 5'-bisphosphate nucleotidase
MTTPALPSDQEILALFEELALEAGHAIMAVYATDFDTFAKADASPVTEADQAAEAIILKGLRARLPGIVCVAEEEVADGKVPAALGAAFILVDPLDGTKEFVGRKGDFTVNIALVRDGAPSIGAVYAPARNTLYAGRPGEASIAEVTPDSQVRDRRPMAVRAAASPPRIVASRSHRTPETDAFIDRHPGAETVSVGSSLKFCLLANGEADLYPRFGRTMEWDTAAGDAVLRAAGGTTTLVDGGAFVYGKRDQAEDVDFANPWFIARGA